MVNRGFCGCCSNLPSQENMRVNPVASKRLAGLNKFKKIEAVRILCKFLDMGSLPKLIWGALLCDREYTCAI
jgi:hypothetical protein